MEKRDLFKFTIPDPGNRTRMTRVFIQVRTPDGSPLDAEAQELLRKALINTLET